MLRHNPLVDHDIARGDATTSSNFAYSVGQLQVV